MRTTTTVIVGADHSGLAMSRCLTERSIDHVLLERGEVAQSWRTGRWDSLCLLTPNWQTRLPGFGYKGPDPDSFMTRPEVVNYLGSSGVLIVGASATGTQLADEIQRSGRPVTLAVGGHVRALRTYRGMDIMWWLDAAGLLDERYDPVDDIARVRSLPSFQLVGSPARASIDLNALQASGVTLVGRLAAINNGTAQFSGSLRNQCTLADLKVGRLLDAIDHWASIIASTTRTKLPAASRQPTSRNRPHCSST